MDLDFDKIEHGVELDDYNYPIKDELGRFASSATPWLLLMVFWISSASSVIGLQNLWPGSPLFWAIGILGCLFFGMVAIIIGLLVLIFTANADLFLHSFGIFVSKAWMESLFPLSVLIVGTRIVRRILFGIQFKRNTAIALFITSSILISISLMGRFPGNFYNWIGNIFTLIGKLF